MALVAYENSDSSEYEDDNDDTRAIIVNNKETVKNDTSEAGSRQDTENKDNDQEQSLFNQLPQPVIGKIKIIEEDDEFLHKKAVPTNVEKPKSKITIPSLSDFRDVENTVPASKPKMACGKKSGLLSMLPQPKNGPTSITTAFIPNVLKQKSQTSSVKKKEPLSTPKIASKPASSIIEYSDESDDEIQNDFFSINKPVEALPEDLPLIDESSSGTSQPSTNITPRSLESYFKKEDNIHMSVMPSQNEEHEDLTLEQIQAQNVPEGSSNEVVLDEEAILKLCGSRGKRKREEIQIVDINQQEVLNDAREMLLKGLMDDTSKRQSASKKRGNEPTSQQRRKHQITYLAHQAKANEVELQNQWASNRMTKRKTQSKYGF